MSYKVSIVVEKDEYGIMHIVLDLKDVNHKVTP